MEFHISRQARDRYQFDSTLYELSGNVIFSDYHSVRKFTQKINQKKDLLSFPEQAARASQINAMGLLDEIFHIVISLYMEKRNPHATENALSHLQQIFGTDEIEKILIHFGAEFPPLAVYQNEVDIIPYLDNETEGIPNRAIVLEEMLMLWLANQNQAFSPYIELFDDSNLQTNTIYREVMQELHAYFDEQPAFGPLNQQLVDMLRSPAIASPNSLQGQLDYIRLHWADLLGSYLFRILTGLDLIKEEGKMRLPGPGEIPIPVYKRSEFLDDVERFSSDREWMPSLVLIAKNTHVWLDQLSKQYQKNIAHLDEIPDEELQTLAQRGFTGLWLIGVWERSRASARIKQLCGNPEAIASAYSLMSYEIAHDLGGEPAYENLRQRAWQFGIRLASDMVPNHMGIDSQWVVDHPDWFLSLDDCPFPSYGFHGENLSQREHVGVFIEDHYFDRTDAAVVFQHIDYPSHRTRYIYHGNDGTSMPWNDTAQLDYLNHEVREAVIETIISVAKKFPIIRFDAAMTLTKRHYQRLWFPEPGSGGDIPSRAEHGMAKVDFDRLMPDEFWREVVDRVTAEVPDTLLLAEAFWLMESYFVRTLGMHRVYNSAFMNILRDEENAKYRLLIKNTLEFDPEILKRYVNFMNNPDERTAVDQFGKGDKYFGICTMMSTLPGLPMFGHGQIEGFSEKYGMEFRRSYWDEHPDEWLVERHQKEIFPLLHRRSLFAEVQNFLLYDFFVSGNEVDENVFAYSNRSGEQRALVIYNNRYESTQGWIHTSVGFSKKDSNGNKEVVQHSLQTGLDLHPSPDHFVIFRDSISNLEYIRSSEELCSKGIFLTLNGYQHHVFLDFREVHDTQGKTYSNLCQYLNGQGVSSIDLALEDYLLRFVQNPFREIANPGYFHYLLDIRNQTLLEREVPAQVLDEACHKMRDLLTGIESLKKESCSQMDIIVSEFRRDFKFILTLTPESPSLLHGDTSKSMLQNIGNDFNNEEEKWLIYILFQFIKAMGKFDERSDRTIGLSWAEEWHFTKIIANTFMAVGKTEEYSWHMVDCLRLMIVQENWYTNNWKAPIHNIMENWLQEPIVRHFINIHRYQDVLWFNKEMFDEFLWWMETLATLEALSNTAKSSTEFAEQIIGAHTICTQIYSAQIKSEFRVDQLLYKLNKIEEKK